MTGIQKYFTGLDQWMVVANFSLHCISISLQKGAPILLYFMKIHCYKYHNHLESRYLGFDRL